MGQWDEFTPATINHIVCEIREGIAKPDEAKKLLKYYCYLVDNEQEIPYLLTRHFRDSFTSCLQEEKSIEAAFGLSRKNGRPKHDEEIRIKMATEVLRSRLFHKLPHQEALSVVSEKFGWGKTVIGEAWQKYKLEAFVSIRIERHVDGFPCNKGVGVKIFSGGLYCID